MHISSHSHHVAQAAGFEVSSTAALAAAQRAVYPAMGSEATSSGMTGEAQAACNIARQRLGGDARIASSGLHIVRRGASTSAKQTCHHWQGCGHRPARGHANFLARQGQKDMLGHEPNSCLFTSRTTRPARAMLTNGLEPRGTFAFSHAAGELAAQLAPHALHRAGGKPLARVVGHGPTPAAGSRVSPGGTTLSGSFSSRAQGRRASRRSLPPAGPKPPWLGAATPASGGSFGCGQALADASGTKVITLDL